MRQITVKNVDRFRDGGTTYIKTDEGTLYSPTPFREDLKATWNDGIKLTELNKNQFDIVENESGVQIRNRS